MDQRLRDVTIAALGKLGIPAAPPDAHGYRPNPQPEPEPEAQPVRVSIGQGDVGSPLYTGKEPGQKLIDALNAATFTIDGREPGWRHLNGGL